MFCSPPAPPAFASTPPHAPNRASPACVVPACVVPCCAALGLLQLLDILVVLDRCAARRPVPSGAAAALSRNASPSPALTSVARPAPNLVSLSLSHCTLGGCCCAAYALALALAPNLVSPSPSLSLSLSPSFSELCSPPSLSPAAVLGVVAGGRSIPSRARLGRCRGVDSMHDRQGAA